MWSNQILRVLDRQRWLDAAGDVLEKVARAAFDHLGPASKPTEDLLHGTPAGHPLHPALVAIPVGSWTAALALDLAGIEEGADLCVDVGIVAALTALLTGLADWRYLQGTQRRTGVAHAIVNITGTTLYSLSSWQRRAGNRGVATTLSNLGFACVAGGGYLGGELAYKLGVMVNRNAWLTGQGDYTAVLPVADLVEDKPTHATAGGEDVVLVKRGERVYALGHSCAHLGAPLSEGSLEGTNIVCPWHGSTFSLEDGRVICGPSAYEQPCYAARIRDGQVEVRLGGVAGEQEPFYRVIGQAEA